MEKFKITDIQFNESHAVICRQRKKLSAIQLFDFTIFYFYLLNLNRLYMY